jgi:hypothetical protein
MFSSIVCCGGGVGLYAMSLRDEETTETVLEVILNDDMGIGAEMAEPTNEMLTSHLYESRGSSVSPADRQYLRMKKIEGLFISIDVNLPSHKFRTSFKDS